MIDLYKHCYMCLFATHIPSLFKSLFRYCFTFLYLSFNTCFYIFLIHNWYKTLCKFKMYNMLICYTYHNMITVIASADISIMSHNFTCACVCVVKTFKLLRCSLLAIFKYLIEFSYIFLIEVLYHICYLQLSSCSLKIEILFSLQSLHR